MLPEGGRQQLEGDVGVAVLSFLPAQIEGLEHSAHAALTEQFDELEAVLDD
jgi:hypothetical protein